MDTFTQTMGSTPLLLIALAAIVAILVAVIVFKLHAFVTLVLVSVLTAAATGIPADQIVSVMLKGFGSTLGIVALVVGFGAMLGRLVECSGGAQAIAERLVKAFGEKRAPLALGVASLLVGFPIFFDAGLIVMLPVIFAVARRLRGPVLAYAIPAAGAFSVMHVFVPPHPGAITAAGLYGADLGWVLIIGLIVAIPTWYVSGYLWGQWCGKKFPFDVPDILLGSAKDHPAATRASAGMTTLILCIPMVLIFCNTGLSTAVAAGWYEKTDWWVRLGGVIGATPIALLITLLIALPVLGLRSGYSRGQLLDALDQALPSVCAVILITGAGGMFGGVLRTSGIGDAVADAMSGAGIPVFIACYLIALLLRIAQGSATVALTTAAALTAPAIIAAGLNPAQLAAVVAVTAAGSVGLSHVNDSGFWLVGKLLGLDPATTLKTWTVNQTLISIIGFVVAAAIYGLAGIAAG